MHLDELEILRWAHGGDGVGIPKSGPLQGMVVFVPGTVPGDIVTCEVVVQKKRWARTRLTSVDRPSSGRVDPPCEVQERCGGCPWMTGDGATQDRARMVILEGECKKRLGWSAEEIAMKVRLVTGSGSSLAYRNRIRMAFVTDEQGRVVMGYRMAGGDEIVDIQTCAIATAAIQQRLPQVRGHLARLGEVRGEVLMVAGEEGVATLVRCEDGTEHRLGPERVTVSQGPARVSVPPEGFVQANPPVAGALVAAVTQVAMQAGGETAVELFAGSGTFTVPLLLAGYRVSAYEVDGGAHQGFLEAVEGMGEASWHRADLLDIGVPLPEPEAPDLVLLDPPRTGGGALMPWVRHCGASTVVMVSCDVATAMGDIAALTQGEGAPYGVASISSYNMFPHTGHQELLVVLKA